MAEREFSTARKLNEFAGQRLLIRCIGQCFQTFELARSRAASLSRPACGKSPGQCEVSVWAARSQFDRQSQFFHRAVGFSESLATACRRQHARRNFRRQINSLSVRTSIPRSIVARTKEFKSKLDSWPQHGKEKFLSHGRNASTASGGCSFSRNTPYM